MEQTPITLPDDLVEALALFGRDQDPPRDPGEIVQTAVRAYLAERGYKPQVRPLRITPAPQGSGVTDLSLHHDRYFAE